MDTLAKRSKAVAQGAIPKGRGFEPHRCHWAEVRAAPSFKGSRPQEAGIEPAQGDPIGLAGRRLVRPPPPPTRQQGRRGERKQAHAGGASRLSRRCLSERPKVERRTTI